MWLGILTKTVPHTAEAEPGSCSLPMASPRKAWKIPGEQVVLSLHGKAIKAGLFSQQRMSAGSTG